MREKTQSKWLFGAGAVLLAGCIALAVWLVCMEEHAKMLPNPEGANTAATSAESATEEDGFVEVDWEYWQSVNPYLVGWVNVEGTAINYPVMRAPANDTSYYLHHNIYGEYSVYGVPFLDSAAAQNGEEMLNAIIYGHHMDDGSMFSDFANYCSQDYAKQHSTVCLQTPEGKQRLQVSFVKIIDGDTTEKATCFESQEAFQTWYEQERSQSNVVLDAPENPEYCVTFCTCSYHQFENERTLVVCVPASN